jgi:hypothetical protein
MTSSWDWVGSGGGPPPLVYTPVSQEPVVNTPPQVYQPEPVFYPENPQRYQQTQQFEQPQQQQVNQGNQQGWDFSPNSWFQPTQGGGFTTPWNPSGRVQESQDFTWEDIGRSFANPSVLGDMAGGGFNPMAAAGIVNRQGLEALESSPEARSDYLGKQTMVAGAGLAGAVATPSLGAAAVGYGKYILGMSAISGGLLPATAAIGTTSWAEEQIKQREASGLSKAEGEWNKYTNLDQYKADLLAQRTPYIDSSLAEYDAQAKLGTLNISRDAYKASLESNFNSWVTNQVNSASSSLKWNDKVYTNRSDFLKDYVSTLGTNRTQLSKEPGFLGAMGRGIQSVWDPFFEGVDTFGNALGPVGQLGAGVVHWSLPYSDMAKDYNKYGQGALVELVPGLGPTFGKAAVTWNDIGDFERGALIAGGVAPLVLPGIFQGAGFVGGKVGSAVFSRLPGPVQTLATNIAGSRIVSIANNFIVQPGLKVVASPYTVPEALGGQMIRGSGALASVIGPNIARAGNFVGTQAVRGANYVGPRLGTGIGVGVDAASDFLANLSPVYRAARGFGRNVVPEGPQGAPNLDPFKPAYSSDYKVTGKSWLRDPLGRGGIIVDQSGLVHTKPYVESKIELFHPDKGIMGTLTYNNMGNKLNVQFLHTLPGFERLGIATRMGKSLLDISATTGLPINTGGFTSEGSPWMQRMFPKGQVDLISGPLEGAFPKTIRPSVDFLREALSGNRSFGSMKGLYQEPVVSSGKVPNLNPFERVSSINLTSDMAGAYERMGKGYWRPVGPNEAFEPGRLFRMNPNAGSSEVFEVGQNPMRGKIPIEPEAGVGGGKPPIEPPRAPEVTPAGEVPRPLTLNDMFGPQIGRTRTPASEGPTSKIIKSEETSGQASTTEGSSQVPITSEGQGSVGQQPPYRSIDLMGAKMAKDPGDAFSQALNASLETPGGQARSSWIGTGEARGAGGSIRGNSGIPRPADLTVSSLESLGPKDFKYLEALRTKGKLVFEYEGTFKGESAKLGFDSSGKLRYVDGKLLADTSGVSYSRYPETQSVGYQSRSGFKPLTEAQQVYIRNFEDLSSLASASKEGKVVLDVYGRLVTVNGKTATSFQKALYNSKRFYSGTSEGYTSTFRSNKPVLAYGENLGGSINLPLRDPYATTLHSGQENLGAVLGVKRVMPAKPGTWTLKDVASEVGPSNIGDTLTKGPKPVTEAPGGGGGFGGSSGSVPLTPGGGGSSVRGGSGGMGTPGAVLNPTAPIGHYYDPASGLVVPIYPGQVIPSPAIRVPARPGTPPWQPPVPGPITPPVPIPVPPPSPVPPPWQPPIPGPVPVPTPPPVPGPGTPPIPQPGRPPIPGPLPVPVPVPQPIPQPGPGPTPRPREEPVPVPYTNPEPIPTSSPVPQPVPQPVPPPRPIPTPITTITTPKLPPIGPPIIPILPLLPALGGGGGGGGGGPAHGMQGNRGIWKFTGMGVYAPNPLPWGKKSVGGWQGRKIMLYGSKIPNEPVVRKARQSSGRSLYSSSKLKKAVTSI